MVARTLRSDRKREVVKMEKEKLERINELANKKKTEGLTESELAEQAALREEFLKDFRMSFSGILDNTVIVTPDGKKKRLSDKNHKI